jgi:hypothetical protein
MRRLLLSLPTALLILIVSVPLCAVNADNYPLDTQYNNTYHQTLTGPFDIIPAFSAADNTTSLPDGLTLAKGVPFIQPIEVDKGQVVTIKVKATNNGDFQLN